MTVQQLPKHMGVANLDCGCGLINHSNGMYDVPREILGDVTPLQIVHKWNGNKLCIEN